MGFNLMNLNAFRYFGDIPPNQMFQLLTTKWNMKENLALAFVDAYGGHVLHASEALTRLADSYEMGDSFEVQDGYGMSIDDVRSCILWAKANNQLSRMLAVLKAIARDGYFEINDLKGDDDHAIFETICRNSVGGPVKRRSFVLGFDKDQWAKIQSKWICVPSSQAMRLILADALKKL